MPGNDLRFTYGLLSVSLSLSLSGVYRSSPLSGTPPHASCLHLPILYRRATGSCLYHPSRGLAAVLFSSPTAGSLKRDECAASAARTAARCRLCTGGRRGTRPAAGHHAPDACAHGRRDTGRAGNARVPAGDLSAAELSGLRCCRCCCCCCAARTGVYSARGGAAPHAAGHCRAVPRHGELMERPPLISALRGRAIEAKKQTTSRPRG